MTTISIASTRPRVPRRRLGQALRRLDLADVSRRLLNIPIALVALALALPLMLLIALAVKLSSRGPVLYTQTRIGLNRRRPRPTGARYRASDCGGKPFTIYKFRTMHVNGHGSADSQQVWATPDDPRITPLGRILRRYRLDELPQLVNVLCGHMNVVGPRPEQPAIFAKLREEIPRYQERQRVRPGITGWAQINQHYDQSIDDVRRKLQFDLEYIGRRSISEDLRIMLLTLPVVAGRLAGW